MKVLTTLRKKGILLIIVICLFFWIMIKSGSEEDIFSTPEKGNERLAAQTALKKKMVSGIDIENNNDTAQGKSDDIPQPDKINIPLEKSPPVQLAERVRSKCKTYLQSLRKQTIIFPVTTNANYNLLFCPMCKLASTYWTKFFKMLEVYKTNTSVLSPYDIPISIAKPTKERLRISQGIPGASMYNGYYKFMFVRDPYTRILSAYVDKLYAPNPTFWKGICSKIITSVRGKSQTKCSSDLTFEEYIQGIIAAHRQKYSGMVDCHDASFLGYCHPCELNFDFIGKMEHFSADSDLLHRKLNLSRTIDTLHKQGKQLADEDALLDTVISPFKWKNEIKSCIPWLEALQRVWRKLQIRGVIGKESLPLTVQQAEEISQQEFIDLIKKTQEKTSYTERKKQRTEALIEIYSQVKMEYLEQLKLSFQTDFDFFEYDNNPANIFNINRESIQYYGYLKL